MHTFGEAFISLVMDLLHTFEEVFVSLVMGFIFVHHLLYW